MTIANSKVESDSTADVVKGAVEPLVKAMLFAWTPPLAEPIKGNTSFAAGTFPSIVTLKADSFLAL